MNRYQLAALALAFAGCTAPISPTGGTSGGGGGGDGGASDGGAGDGGPNDPGAAWPACGAAVDCAGAAAEFQGIAMNLGALVDGGTATFGGLSIVTTFDGGAKTVVVNPGKHPYLTVVYPDSNHVTATGDFNQDGIVDYTYQGVVSGTTVEGTELTDTNFDGVFDQQDVASYDTSTTFPTNYTDTFSLLQVPDGGGDAGVWVQSWTYQGAAVALGGSGSCDGYAGFPDATASGVTLTPVPGTQINIVTGDPYTQDGTCSAYGAAVLVADFQEAIYLSSFCYILINPDLGDQLATALQTQPLQVGCGNSCSGVAASTDLAWGKYSAYRHNKVPQRMNLNPAVMVPETDIQRVEILIHELLHYAGIPHTPPPAGDPAGHDRPYGCGRYCTMCKSYNATYGGSNTPLGYSWDCSVCADPAHVEVCGYSNFGTSTDEAACNAAGEGTDCTACISMQKTSCNQGDPRPLPSATPEPCCSGCGSACSPYCVPGQADWNQTSEFNSCDAYPVGYCTSGA